MVQLTATPGGCRRQRPKQEAEPHLPLQLPSRSVLLGNHSPHNTTDTHLARCTKQSSGPHREAGAESGPRLQVPQRRLGRLLGGGVVAERGPQAVKDRRQVLRPQGRHGCRNGRRGAVAEAAAKPTRRSEASAAPLAARVRPDDRRNCPKAGPACPKRPGCCRRATTGGEESERPATID